MNFKINNFAFLFFTIPFLTGCVASSGALTWPSTTYPYSCRMMPSEPMCIMSGDGVEEFKYRGQFPACRQSMLNFSNALEDHYQCANTELKNIFDNLLKQVPATYNCYVEYFRDRKEGDPSIDCPPVVIPNYVNSFEADGLEYDFGVPSCIGRHKGYKVYPPKHSFMLDSCKREVEEFTGKGSSSYSFNSKSAQRQFDTFLENLREIINRKSDDAIRKFNCMADRNDFCF